MPMDDKKEFEFDLALSLLSRDEPLAFEIADLLSDRYKVFLYSQQQREMLGTDGELTCKAVFAEQTRFALVLYRPEWGSTPWTRMEEEAIRGRAYEDGYDFVKFMVLTDDATPPKYLPRTQFWINGLHHGAAGAAAVIDARLQELGAAPRIETAESHAARLHRSLEFEDRRRKFMGSMEGVGQSDEQFQALGAETENVVARMNASGHLGLSVKRDAARAFVIVGLEKGLLVTWRRKFSNTLQDAVLDVELWNEHPPWGQWVPWQRSTPVRSLQFVFDLLPQGVGGWVENKKNGNRFETVGLADYLLRWYMANGA